MSEKFLKWAKYAPVNHEVLANTPYGLLEISLFDRDEFGIHIKTKFDLYGLVDYDEAGGPEWELLSDYYEDEST